MDEFLLQEPRLDRNLAEAEHHCTLQSNDSQQAPFLSLQVDDWSEQPRKSLPSMITDQHQEDTSQQQ